MTSLDKARKTETWILKNQVKALNVLHGFFNDDKDEENLAAAKQVLRERNAKKDKQVMVTKSQIQTLRTGLAESGDPYLITLDQLASDSQLEIIIKHLTSKKEKQHNET